MHQRDTRKIIMAKNTAHPGEILKQHRERKQMSMDDCSSELRVSKSTIHNIENSVVSTSFDIVVDYARFLGKPALNDLCRFIRKC